MLLHISVDVIRIGVIVAAQSDKLQKRFKKCLITARNLVGLVEPVTFCQYFGLCMQLTTTYRRVQEFWREPPQIPDLLRPF